jgi:hypothetical protein
MGSETPEYFTNLLYNGLDNIEEDLLLVSAWLNVSLDAVKGNEQKSCQYWTRIWEYFHEHKTFQSDRKATSLQHHWGLIQSTVNKFCGFYEQVENQRKSGETEQDKVIMVYNVVYLIYLCLF